MPYKNLKAVPNTLKAAMNNNLRFANLWASFYDEFRKTKNESISARLAWMTFKKLYKKAKGKWTKRD